MHLRKVISNIQPEIVSLGDIQVLKLKDASVLNRVSNEHFHVIIVEKESLISHILQNDELYLTPLFFMGNSKRQVDGLFDEKNPYAIVQKTQNIRRSISFFENIPLPPDSDQRLLVKVLRYLISRSASLKAVASRQSHIGYQYPLIEDMSIESDPLQILQLLNKYADKDFFKADIIDNVNLCYECNSNYLNFSECCTKCHSIDLKTENLIHHFRCAYIGPESDFIKDNQMKCPKCDHLLKHIGIDYDKPSEIHTCRSCNHSSQETTMKAKCVDCSKENNLDQLTTYHINDYSPTEKGRNIASRAFEQIHISPDISSSITESTPYSSYLLIREHEKKKNLSAAKKNHELTIKISEHILDQLNPTLQNSLLYELISIIKPYLQENDMVAACPNGTIYCLLLNYKKVLANELGNILNYNLNKMLKDNNWTEDQAVFIQRQKLK